MNTVRMVCELIWTCLSSLDSAKKSTHRSVPSFPSVTLLAVVFVLGKVAGHMVGLIVNTTILAK